MYYNKDYPWFEDILDLDLMGFNDYLVINDDDTIRTFFNSILLSNFNTRRISLRIEQINYYYKLFKSKLHTTMYQYYFNTAMYSDLVKLHSLKENLGGITTSTTITDSHTDYLIKANTGSTTTHNTTNTTNRTGSDTSEHTQEGTDTNITEQLEDTENITLNADSPNNMVTSLTSQSWDNSSLVSSATKNINNSGKTKTEHTVSDDYKSTDKTIHNTTDTTTNTGSDSTVNTGGNDTQLDVTVTNTTQNLNLIDEYKKLMDSFSNSYINDIISKFDDLFINCYDNTFYEEA